MSGLVHMANKEITSWFGLTCELAELAGIDPTLVIPCSSEDYPQLATRPRNSVLDSERLTSLGIQRLPSHRRGLSRVVTEWRDS
jgi:dTDP-4-dehydrorhamnose reductase